MTYEAKPGSFSLFKNLDKNKDNHPDYKGDGKDLDGNPIWVNAWLKKSAKGTFMSCSFKLKEQKKPATKNAYAARDDDETPPF
jgi:hypothetical protein